MFDTYYSDDGNAWINFTLKDAAGFSAMGLDALAYYNDGSTFGRGWSYASRLDASDYADVNALQPAGGAGYFRGWGDFFLTSCNGGACANPSGRFDYAVYIDFGLQEFGGKGSSGSVYAAAEAVNLGGAPVSASDALSIGAQPYALFSEINYFTAASPSTYLAMNFTLRDVAGAAAMGLDASAFYNNGSGLIGSGMSYAPRRDVSMWDGANGIQSIGNVTGWYSGSAPLAFSKCNGTACVSPSGSFSYALLVDFANQVIGGGNSGASVSGQYESDGAVYFSDGLFIPKADYSALSGPAHISAKSYSQFLETDFSLVDEAGVTGGSLLALAYYGDSNNTEAFAFDSALQASLPVFAGASTWADIAGLSLGTGHYGGSAPFSLTTCYGFPCGPQTGFFTYLLNIDFAKKTYSGAAYLLARELSEVGANIRGKVYFPGVTRPPSS
ncbi:MAG: hypothetical protein HZB91_11240 [Elusimicrobia bacterium]|nr:hypothetical protein [Elusimicrobiota bacterium]